MGTRRPGDQSIYDQHVIREAMDFHNWIDSETSKAGLDQHQHSFTRGTLFVLLTHAYAPSDNTGTTIVVTG